MSGKGIKKNYFYKNKKLFKIDGIDVNEILVSRKRIIWYKKSLKYFIEYSHNDDIGPKCIKLPQMISYVKHFDSN